MIYKDSYVKAAGKFVYLGQQLHPMQLFNFSKIETAHILQSKFLEHNNTKYFRRWQNGSRSPVWATHMSKTIGTT